MGYLILVIVVVVWAIKGSKRKTFGDMTDEETRNFWMVINPENLASGKEHYKEEKKE